MHSFETVQMLFSSFNRIDSSCVDLMLDKRKIIFKEHLLQGLSGKRIFTDVAKLEAIKPLPEVFYPKFLISALGISNGYAYSLVRTPGFPAVFQRNRIIINKQGFIRWMVEWKKANRIPHSEEDFVFIGAKNKGIEPRVFYKYYQEVMKEAGIEDCNFHTLRHTFATRCIENGADILMVSRTLGHSNISTTLNKYSHLLPKHQKACMEKLEAIYHP